MSKGRRFQNIKSFFPYKRGVLFLNCKMMLFQEEEVLRFLFWCFNCLPNQDHVCSDI